MKHILPILTITTLAAAASAQSAASSGLSYNRVGIHYLRSNGSDAWAVSAAAMIGSSNFRVSGSTYIGGDAGNGGDQVALGYVFKNVLAGADAELSVGSNEVYGLNFRKDVGNNIEVGAGYVRASGSNLWDVELAYNVSKQVQLAVGYQDGADLVDGITRFTVRYNF